MILIAHRGNTNGRFESYENEPAYIDLALNKGIDVEIDIWFKDNALWLGHDKPMYMIPLTWLLGRTPKLWIHCKNIEALIYFNSLSHIFNYFWHETDKATLTSTGIIWAYPNNQPIKNSIAVLPESFNDDISQALGVCSDFIEIYE